MHGTILIVDDQEIGRITLEGMLLPLGYDLHFAASGREALALLDRVRPDVVLLDVMMPEMDGFTVCRRIRATPRWRDVPVILVTALDDRDSRIRGLEAGADDFVSKPVDWAELRARVQTTISLGRTRRQLQERAKFEWAVTHSSDGFLWVDQAGICQLANPVAQRWLGLDPASLPPRPWLDCAAEAFTPLAESFDVQPELNWSALRDAGQPFQLTLVRPETPQLEELWLQVTASPLPAAEGQAAGWLVHLKDVTALQRHVRQTITLLDLISHKLRTPLMLIRGSLEILEDGLCQVGSAEWFRWRDTALNATTRLNLDVEQLLNVAVQLAGSSDNAQRGQLSATEIAESIQRACQDLELPAENCTLHHTATRPLHLNPPTLDLILRQLLNNARKFHPQQAPRVQISVHDEETGGVRLEVEDDGPGIPLELQAQVWLPFYQIDRWRTGQVPGMGMGLTLVANCVWEAGGRCWIERAAGGTRVCLTLPAAR
jgi:CheY-like chemotaxis protein